MRKLRLEELNRVSADAYREMPKVPVVVVLDNIRSGMNAGSFFRTADAFKVERLYLAGITPRPPHREISKTAIGATQSVEWTHEESIVDIVNKLKEQGYFVWGVEQTTLSKQLHQMQWAYPLALVFGNEVDGLSASVLPLLDGCIEIPQFGTKHSLNVSVCAGIVMWESLKPLLDQ